MGDIWGVFFLIQVYEYLHFCGKKGYPGWAILLGVTVNLVLRATSILSSLFSISLFHWLPFSSLDTVKSHS